MARRTTPSPSEREHRTIILPVSQEHYGAILSTPARFRQWVDENYERHPKLFPVEMEQGYRLNGTRTDKKLDLTVRRIRFADNVCYSIWPSFAMPYAVALTQNVAHGLRLRKWNVPYEVLAVIFGWSWTRCFGLVCEVGALERVVQASRRSCNEQHVGPFDAESEQVF